MLLVLLLLPLLLLTPSLLLPQSDWRGYIWNRVLVDTLIPEALNASMFEPIRAAFPRIRLSNFAHSHRSDPAGRGYENALGGWWSHSFATSSTTPVGTGAHVGTAQSSGFYGGKNTTIILETALPQRQQSVEGSAFAALLLTAAVARDMALAAPGVAVQPWFAPRLALWHECGPDHLQPCGWPWVAGSGGVNETLWAENVYHVLLETAATTVLWWQPGAQLPIGLGLDELEATLQELEGAITYACGGGGGTPVRGLGASDNATWLVDSWASSYILSGMEISCGGGGSGKNKNKKNSKTAQLHRFTPRCLDINDGYSVFCSSVRDTKNGSEVAIRVGSGFEWGARPEQRLWLPAEPVSHAGWWLVTHPAA